jgi:thiamine kinase-like enzyme
VDDSTARSTADPILEAVVEAMPGWTAAHRLRVRPIEGGITNRNFRVDVDGRSYVVRVAGTGTELLGIDREAERTAAEAAAAVGIGPEVVAHLPRLGSMVTRFLDGSAVPVEAMRESRILRLVVRSLLAFHEGPAIRGAFSPFRVVERYRATAMDRGVSIPVVVDTLRARAQEIEGALARFAPCPCHNDLLNANFILVDDRMYIVDYEYAGMGDPVFDLANFAVNHGFDDVDDARLVEAYFGEANPQRIGRLKLMRIMSDFREGMWGVVQQGLSTLDFDYVAYAERHLERAHRSAADPRIRSWMKAAAHGASG